MTYCSISVTTIITCSVGSKQWKGALNRIMPSLFSLLRRCFVRRPWAQTLSCMYYIASLRNVLLTFFSLCSFVTRSQGFLYLRDFQNLALNQTSFLIKHYRPFPHYAPVSKHKEMKTRLGWTISYKSLYFVHPSLELVPLFTGMRERSIESIIKIIKIRVCILKT